MISKRSFKIFLVFFLRQLLSTVNVITVGFFLSESGGIRDSLLLFGTTKLDLVGFLNTWSQVGRGSGSGLVPVCGARPNS